MKQQINFNNFIVQPVKSSITIRLVITTLVSSMALLAFVYVLTLWHYVQHQTVARKLISQLSITQNNLRELAIRYPRLPVAQAVIKSEKNIICRNNFSTYLTVFAKDKNPDIWLSEISFADGGKQLTLRGHAVFAEDVEPYLAYLKSTDAFKAYAFDVQEISAITVDDPKTKKSKVYFNFLVTGQGA